MSPLGHFVRHHKQQTDRAISQAYATPTATAIDPDTPDSRTRTAFDELLHCVRERAPRLLLAPIDRSASRKSDGDGDHHRYLHHLHHPGVAALFNLARFAHAYVRPIASWPGTQASWRGAVRDLAQHLLARYPVPRFLAAAWYATDSSTPYAEASRAWFIAHGAGASFRSLDLPIRMTRPMERIFLASRDHLEIAQAMRRAELFALGAGVDIVDAVLATRVGSHLANGDFWRTVWTLLIANAGRGLDVTQIRPIVDFLDAIRHERVAVDTGHGIVMREPPHPDFSLEGRTLRSLRRLMSDWQSGLHSMARGLRWEPSALRPLRIEVPRQGPSAPPQVWELTELTDGQQLRAEGDALHHCAASYTYRCWRGESQLWSLRLRSGSRVRPVVTVEVYPARRTIVQARGHFNRPAAGKALRLIRLWAEREQLRLPSCAILRI